MNRALPPGDRGDRSSDPGRPSGGRGPLSWVGRLVWGSPEDREGTGHAAPGSANVHEIATVASRLAHVGAGHDTWPCAPTSANQEPTNGKTPPQRKPGGPRRCGELLPVDAVGAFSALGLE